jgi:putative transposase
MTSELRRCGLEGQSQTREALDAGRQLLCLRRRKFVLTTDSNHEQPVYPNLVRKLLLNEIGQLWVADITYIWLETEFVYLAVVLDVFSRRVIGCGLDRTLEVDLSLAALRIALALRQPDEGLLHHSDRGVQYASTDYTQLLRDDGISISMSRKANPWGQCSLRIVHEDLEIRRGLSAGVSRSGRSAAVHSGVSGKSLQLQATAFAAGLT